MPHVVETPMPSVAANGIELVYRVDGDGDETLVLVNGLADTKETWELQIPAFAERYRVLSYDNRGVGESSTPEGPYTTAQMADDLAALVDALEISRFHLLGVSMGGMIAQEYAIAHADRLLSASFCCTYSYPGPFCLRMFSCWRDLVPHLGVGFTQREGAAVGVHDGFLRRAYGRARGDRAFHGRESPAFRQLPRSAVVDRDARHARKALGSDVPADDARRER
jgi:pimeloyl-ACP methyl ester carboxylesterase